MSTTATITRRAKAASKVEETPPIEVQPSFSDPPTWATFRPILTTLFFLSSLVFVWSEVFYEQRAETERAETRDCLEHAWSPLVASYFWPDVPIYGFVGVGKDLACPDLHPERDDEYAHWCAMAAIVLALASLGLMSNVEDDEGSGPEKAEGDQAPTEARAVDYKGAETGAMARRPSTAAGA